MSLNNRLINTDSGGIVPSEHFNTVLYAGTGATQSITGVGFQPDFAWIKSRSGANINWHSLLDNVRGANKILFSNSTSQEITYTDTLTSFDSDGFSLGADATAKSVNWASTNYVAWCLKAGGAASSNTDGTITSSVSANQEAGFSIVTYTGNGGTATVGHGLGVAPKMIIVKDRDGVNDWAIYHQSNGNSAWMQFNTSAVSTGVNFWNNTDPTSSVFSIVYGGIVNTLNSKYIAYCFAEVDGFSSIGSYTPASGDDTITTGFKPKFVMVKRTDTAGGNWEIHDGVRFSTIYTDTGASSRLRANDGSAEGSFTDSPINFTDTGFVLDSSVTGDSYIDYDVTGGTYIYIAFAADPA